MKTAIVFFSYDGSTRTAAKVLSEKTGADIFELEEKAKRGRSPLSFMAAGFAASIGKRSRLKSTFWQQMKEYGKIYIGTPIWAGKAVPAVNTFVHSLAAEGKEIVLFTLQADPEPDKKQSKSIETFKTLLEKKGASVTGTARLHGAAPGKTVRAEDIQRQLVKFDF